MGRPCRVIVIASRYSRGMRNLSIPTTLAASLLISSPALAWGDLGHEVTALIAYQRLTPTAKAKLDQLLASDHDPLTPPDIASRATWADKYRNSHRETAAWHFVDIEIDHPDLSAACFGFPKIPTGTPASQGPANDCVVDKIGEFATELRNPATPPAERLLALKFLIHFVGDLHQPLHASDHNDRGGNCIGLNPPVRPSNNLHAYWDTAVVEALGGSAMSIAANLNARIKPAGAKAWSAGDPKVWAMEAFKISQRDAYNLPTKPTCGDRGSVTLSPAYQQTAQADAAVQLEKAGVRMASVLDAALR